MYTNRFLWVLLVVCFSAGSGYAQIGNVIHKRNSSKKTRQSQKANRVDTKRLAKLITKNHPTDFEKAAAIFTWLAQNIEYDTELRTDIQLQQSIYTSEKHVIEKVLERKKALCGGYAFLFKQLCADIGIQAAVIHGYSKKYYKLTEEREQVDHTWNAVKLNGSWRLLDLTLARSQRNGNKPNTYWFNTPPTFFIKTHYPEDEKWALVSNPISKREFERLPSQD